MRLRLPFIALFLFLLSISVWSGTLKDDFEDGNWYGWTPIATLIWDTDVADRISVVDGVLRLDHINNSGYSLCLITGKDWGDYSFSADMRLVEIEPGAD